jgi:hypothetical protein
MTENVVDSVKTIEIDGVLLREATLKELAYLQENCNERLGDFKDALLRVVQQLDSDAQQHKNEPLEVERLSGLMSDMGALIKTLRVLCNNAAVILFTMIHLFDADMIDTLGDIILY